MAKGILYTMETVVPGLIKIGRCGIGLYGQRMYDLEHNGYCNVTGLKRKFAIEVEDYIEKEDMLKEIFCKNRIGGSELYALDIDRAIQLLSSFEGKQVFPVNEDKEELFKNATENATEKRDLLLIPNGIYYFNINKKSFGEITAKLKIEDGNCILLKGSICAPVTSSRMLKVRDNAEIENNILQEDLPCNSVSSACFVVYGERLNGWKEWKTEDKQSIDIFRKSNTKEEL